MVQLIYYLYIDLNCNCTCNCYYNTAVITFTTKNNVTSVETGTIYVMTLFFFKTVTTQIDAVLSKLTSTAFYKVHKHMCISKSDMNWFETLTLFIILDKLYWESNIASDFVNVRLNGFLCDNVVSPRCTLPNWYYSYITLNNMKLWILVSIHRT